MVNMLLATSLILNIVALLCIILLYLRQNRFLQVEKKQEKLMNEMEEVISAYLIEMKEENENFIKKVSEIRRNPGIEQENHEEATSHLSLDVQEKSIDKIQPNEDKQALVYRKGSVYQAVQAYKNTHKLQDGSPSKEPTMRPLQRKAKVEDGQFEKRSKLDQELQKNNDLYMKSLLNQALLLQKQGLSTEEIARKLNKGKTEIELLLKFRQNGQE